MEENIIEETKGNTIETINDIFARQQVLIEKETFEMYKFNNLTDMTSQDEINCSILTLLEALGYPMDEVGTYLYKDIISECYGIIKDGEIYSDVDRCQNLLANLSDNYSNFYKAVAFKYKALNIYMFNFYIKNAINQIDKTKVDANIINQVLGQELLNENYGLTACRLATLIPMVQNMENRSRKNTDLTLVKKLERIG